MQLLVYRDCAGNQGDVLVWDNLVIRSWNSPAPAGATCDGQVVELGFEGPHVFDICDRMDPQLLASVNMTAATLPIRGCGSHTATLVPDVANGQLFVYISDVPDHHALSIRYEVTRRPCSLTSAANSGFDDVPRDRAGRWSPPKRIPD